ncbi:Vegetative incompatibility protein HET-E-1 [Fulvia fulva]|uniref:Vegetative incompatibility protein HET-E-1 n=1 Tax=Passalora fulva TaxID=5499 RepID=A0A9Q8LIN5_PASFU|nr:Vegetative incompatibility protein HET-E-1 [Fulvia fulva]KAK4625034.1 hypothetical protein CLAFUR0_05696 [Fulvia fulva]UJO18200.1 Vegetative incompatibility protein HET-E-1 [Fulvia fulva]
MRLINTKTLKLSEFPDSRCPKYAILSHTWGSKEVALSDWQRLEYRATRKGFAKIAGLCKLASSVYSLDYAWVDTCCIDKSSSADLSEGINSMYRYYEEAAVCIVYMSDVPASCNALEDKAVNQSRWFTRGWTLQELLVPKHVAFFGQGWNLLGILSSNSKRGEAKSIAEYTNIPEEVLKHVKRPSG